MVVGILLRLASQVDFLDCILDKVGILAGEFEVAEALNGVKIFQHILVQKELVEKFVVGLGCRLGGIIHGLDAVGRAVLLPVEQAACMKSQLSWRRRR